jgi:two-component system NtrC family sensor kinase
MIQSTVDGIVVVDIKGNVLIFNKGMEKLTGYAANEIVDWGHLSSFYDIDVAKENMKKMRSDKYGPIGKLNPTSMTITCKNGEQIPATLSASIMTIGGEEIGSVGVFTDMREILKMRKDLEEAHLQLVQSDKIASVGRMAAGVAHEINNPLGSILLFTRLVLNKCPADSVMRDNLERIEREVKRCQNIVKGLLEFARQREPKTETVDLNDLLEKTIGLVENQSMFHDIKVVKHYQIDLPTAVVDPSQVQQVFINLIMNAVDAMEGRGTLTLSTEFSEDSDAVVICFTDTGCGIEQETVDRVFEPFFTTKGVGHGTGLGLSISHGIIKKHGGDINVSSRPGEGSRFVVVLPEDKGDTE